MKLNVDLDELQRLLTAQDTLNAATSQEGVSDDELDKLYEELDPIEDEIRTKLEPLQGNVRFLADNLRSLADNLEDAESDLESADSIAKAVRVIEALPDEVAEAIRKARIYQED